MEAADEVMMAFVVTGEPKLEFVVVQEGDARDNLLPPPPASLRRLRFCFTFRFGICFGLIASLVLD